MMLQSKGQIQSDQANRLWGRQVGVQLGGPNQTAHWTSFPFTVAELRESNDNWPITPASEITN